MSGWKSTTRSRPRGGAGGPSRPMPYATVLSPSAAQAPSPTPTPLHRDQGRGVCPGTTSGGNQKVGGEASATAVPGSNASGTRCRTHTDRPSRHGARGTKRRRGRSREGDKATSCPSSSRTLRSQWTRLLLILVPSALERAEINPPFRRRRGGGPSSARRGARRRAWPSRLLLGI